MPENSTFFSTYARLAGSIRAAGLFAQVVSAATEFSILYALSYQAIAPILPELAQYFAGAVAVLGVVVIEGGLRVTTPQAVDAVLHRRFSGLHLVMSAAVFVVVVLLGAASGWLSFVNSTAIVAGMTEQRFDNERMAADSTYNAATAEQRAAWQADSAAITAKHATLIEAATAAGNARKAAAQTELSNIRRKEARTGQSFATARDEAKAKLAAIQAETAGTLATMQAAQQNELSAARQAFREKIEGAEGTRSGSLAAIDTDQAGTIAKYGGGLGWFTVICLIVFFAAVILDRVHHKGSEIAETVELSQYDVNPHWWTNLRAAISERWNFAVQSRITAFADRTPPPPLPAKPAELYSPTALSNVTITLRINQGEDGAGNVIEVTPKRRQIGFQSRDTFTAHEKPEGVHESSTRKMPAEMPDLRDLKTRLKFYKKRLGSFQQKASKLERAGKPIPKRTADAITNNEHWVQHFTELIRQATGK